MEEGASCPFRLFSFEQTSSRTCPPLHAHNDCALTHAVCHLGPVVQLQGFQWPVGIGHHANPLRGHEDGHVRGSVAGLHNVFGGVENLDRVVYKPAHNSLIGV